MVERGCSKMCDYCNRRISEKGGEGEMMRCIANCPELDYDNSRHCTRCSQTEIDYMYEVYPDGCPVGNNPIWEEVEEPV